MNKFGSALWKLRTYCVDLGVLRTWKMDGFFVSVLSCLLSIVIFKYKILLKLLNEVEKMSKEQSGFHWVQVVLSTSVVCPCQRSLVNVSVRAPLILTMFSWTMRSVS